MICKRCYAAQKAGRSRRTKIVFGGDEVRIELPLSRYKSVMKYQKTTARRKWYVHEARSTKGFEGNIVESVLWVSPKGGLGKYSPNDFQALYDSHQITGNTCQWSLGWVASTVKILYNLTMVAMSSAYHP